MSKARPDALAEWRAVVPLVQKLVEGRSEAEIDRRPDAESMTLRETVHHVVEANVVAASIVTAALGSPGSVYDWSWMLPFGKWMEQMRYDRKPLAPSLRLLEALNEYVAAQIEPLEDGLERRVRLRDQPDGPLREVTVADVLIQEAEHAREHFEEAMGHK
ncbi:MAG TPA: DinB family protein [Planctomycetota bacterium]|jgi:Lon protease-like protein|nr:DinB family protein [Planctomycetota bacterium]